jgi:hypothetical protein
VDCLGVAILPTHTTPCLLNRKPAHVFGLAAESQRRAC